MKTVNCNASNKITVQTMMYVLITVARIIMRHALTISNTVIPVA